MLVTFSTDEYANIIMFGDNAFDMLIMMGHSATVPGAIKAEDVPEALSRLKAATELEKTRPATGKENANVPVVSLAHRGLLLIELLSAAVKSKSHVMWEKTTALS